jgi:hypothetical protein
VGIGKDHMSSSSKFRGSNPKVEASSGCIGFLFHCKRIIHIVKQAGLLVHNASAGSERSYLHHTVTLIGSFVPSHESTHSTTCLTSKHVMHRLSLRSHVASDEETLIGPRRSGANECTESSLPGSTLQVDAIFEADNTDF